MSAKVPTHRFTRSTRKSGLSLKTLFFSFGFLLFIFLFGISSALSLLTTRMHTEAIQIRTRMASVRAAQAIKVHLLEFSRINSILALTNNPKYQALSLKEEVAIHDWLDRAKGIEKTRELQGRINRVEESVFYYLTARKKLAKKGSLKKAIGETTGPLEDALASFDILVADNTHRADQAIVDSERTDQISSRLSKVGVVCAFLFFVTIIVATSKYLYSPLNRIYDAILTFSNGKKNSRAPEEGLKDLKLIAAQFNSLADQTNEFSRKRAQFLAGTAHDIRTPLTALKSSVELLKSHFVKFSEKQRTDCLSLIEKQIVRMESLTSSFLDTVRIESGEFRLNTRKVDVTQLVRDAVELWSSYSNKHKLISKIQQGPIYLECDPVRIDQIMTNLISNAIKYSPKGGIIEVSLQSSGEMTAIAIKDQGLGISHDEIGNIFEAFHRSESAQDLVPGIGIGLWITKRLVEAHHGNIQVESEVGKGATFKIQFPNGTAG